MTTLSTLQKMDKDSLTALAEDLHAMAIRIEAMESRLANVHHIDRRTDPWVFDSLDGARKDIERIERMARNVMQ